MESWWRSAAPALVSVLVVVLFGASLILWLMKPPQVESQTLGMIMGGLVAAFTQVVNYWLGSSAGSQRKDETIRQIASGEPPPAQGG